MECDKVRERGDARVELVTIDLISRARARDGDRGPAGYLGSRNHQGFYHVGLPDRARGG
jgi:hypothetical protein